MSNSDEFNPRFRKLLYRFCLNRQKTERLDYSNYLKQNAEFNSDIFVLVNSQSKNQSVCSLANVRLILLANFVSKIIGKKVVINVHSQNEDEIKKLNSIFELFNLNQNCSLKTINETNNLKELLNKIDQKYRKLDKGDDIWIDFSQIITDSKLQNYDVNLNKGYADNLGLLMNCYHEFLSQSLNDAETVITVCSNSDLFQNQKTDIILRSWEEAELKFKSYRHKFICTGSVKVDDTEPNQISTDFCEHYETRKGFFKYSAEQRLVLSEELSTSNIESLTLFSIVFDFFNSNYQTDIKKFKCIDLEQMELDDRVKLGEQSSFILYNCARISAILEKFDSFVKQGRYKELKSIEDLDFQSLLKNDAEKKICSQYLFKYETILDEIYDSLTKQNDCSLHIKINISKLFSFASDLINKFSRYYSKIHILEDPKFDHLHDTMHARIYLIKLIYNIIQDIIGMFNINPLVRI